MIYLIQAAHLPFFKVGYVDADVAKRCRDLQCGCPFFLRVLATIDGSRTDERRVHGELRTWQSIGEWFLGAPEAIGYLQELFGVRIEPMRTVDDIVVQLLIEDKLRQLNERRDSLASNMKMAEMAIDDVDFYVAQLKGGEFVTELRRLREDNTVRAVSEILLGRSEE